MDFRVSGGPRPLGLGRAAARRGSDHRIEGVRPEHRPRLLVGHQALGPPGGAQPGDLFVQLAAASRRHHQHPRTAAAIARSASPGEYRPPARKRSAPTVTGGHTPGTVLLAAKASTRSTPGSASTTHRSPLAARRSWLDGHHDDLPLGPDDGVPPAGDHRSADGFGDGVGAEGERPDRATRSSRSGTYSSERPSLPPLRRRHRREEGPRSAGSGRSAAVGVGLRESGAERCATVTPADVPMPRYR